MNRTALCALLAAGLAGCAHSTRPDTSQIDTSGAMFHYCSKGWLADTPSRRVAVTCTHSNPSAGITVTFGAQAISRKVIRTYPVRVPITPDGSVPTDFSRVIFEHFFAGDVTVLVLDEAVPQGIRAYQLAASVKDGEWVMPLDQNHVTGTAQINLHGSDLMATLRNKSHAPIGGDSGLPWFNARNEVVSHWTAGATGYGPVYSNPLMSGVLRATLNEAEASTK